MMLAMSVLPHALYRAAEVRELDRRAIEEHGIPGEELMQRAGRNAFELMRRRWPRAHCIVIMCGTGNNGGDGFVVAKLCHEAGLEVRVFQVGDGSRIRGDARTMADAFSATGRQIETFTDKTDLGGAEIVVDAMLGTGLSGNVEGTWRAAIRAINRSGAAVLSLDIPSGLHADTGQALGLAVQANLTITFIGLKQGLFTGQGQHYCGEVHYHDLRVPPQVLMAIRPQASLLDITALAHLLAPRARSAHKGQFGHVLVIGGEQGMSGAVRLAGEAALRVGAGLVSVATRASHAPLISQARPELMAHGIESRRELRHVSGKANVIAIGPGLGQGEWGQDMFGAALDCGLPLIVDADALNLLAQEPLHREDWVLTPHPGEAARLLACSSAEIEADRFSAVQELQARYGGTIVLKGSGTLVHSTRQPVGVCAAGNPGMASGGMGDVLTGVIAGLLAQLSTKSQVEAARQLAVTARLGVCLHAEAADDAARSEGERGMLASDLMPWLRAAANPDGRG
jgi:hydroxyethylthiazole kinase-like uncharacterized protein yjeF